MAKPVTTYTPVTKPTTSYDTNPDLADAVQLNSDTVTLDSLSVYLNGFTTPLAPNTLNDKNSTPFAAVAKNATAYAEL